MNRLRSLASLLVLLLAASFASAADLGWPRTIEQPSGRLVLFEPHVDSWDSDIVWRQAFQLTPAGGPMTIGAAAFEGATKTDSDRQIVTVSSAQVTGIYFPAVDPTAVPQLDALLRSLMPSAVDLSLLKLVAYMRTPASLRDEPPPATSPQILVSYSPAVLLQLDGAPSLAPVEQTHLKVVTNTSWPLFQDAAGQRFYLLAGNLWLEARRLEGPWERTLRLPEDFKRLPQTDRFSAARKAVPPPQERGARVPAVLYVTTPAEVILFEGQPSYIAVAGTQLERATNTKSWVFRLGSEQKTYYYLTRGRWFSASSLKGPWSYATPNLPADFSRIDLGDPAAAVLAAVPGTSLAEEAALVRQVPKTPVNAPAQLQVTYFGAPQFVPVDGAPISYASNTAYADKVLLIGGVYYLMRSGAWYMAPTPQGPWAASDVPQAIYLIPASSPVYSVTYLSQAGW